MLKSQTSGKSTENAVEEIKNRLDILEIVSEQVVLKKSGRNYWGLCPFHKEKTPSFSVNPEKNIYKCFGCGAGGDSISFLMKTNNISFWETMVMLAQKFGIELPEAGVTSQNADLKKQILKINAEVVNYYKKLLLESPEAQQAREYLRKRGINEEVMEKFNLGFAPNNYDTLLKKYNRDVLDSAGLVSEKSSGTGYIDRFRNRIMIPIQDGQGDFIAFGARAMADGQGPKYLNSPDTLVFNKSRSLFALCQAKNAIKEQDSVILMEGYFDVISAHTHGLANVVATLGTALTEQHIKMIAKYSRRIYLAFDSDEAGVNATDRGAEVIKAAFSGLGEIKYFDESFSVSGKSNTVCEVRVVTTSSGKDPDEFLRTEGAEAYIRLVQEAPLLVDYRLNRLLSQNKKDSTPQDKARLSREIILLLSEIRNSIIRNEYIRLVADRLAIDEAALSAEVNKSLQIPHRHEVNTKNIVTINKNEKYILAQKNLLSLYFLNNEKFSPLCINNYIREIDITEAGLRLIREKIEELINESIDSDELFKRLMTGFAGNEEVINQLVDIACLTDDKREMSVDSIEKYINDHIVYLGTYQVSERKKELRASYYADNNDDMSSVLHQYRVKELLEERRL